MFAAKIYDSTFYKNRLIVAKEKGKRKQSSYPETCVISMMGSIQQIFNSTKFVFNKVSRSVKKAAYISWSFGHLSFNRADGAKVLHRSQNTLMQSQTTAVIFNWGSAEPKGSASIC